MGFIHFLGLKGQNTEGVQNIKAVSKPFEKLYRVEIKTLGHTNHPRKNSDSVTILAVTLKC